MSYPRKTPLSTSIRGRAESYTRDRWSQYRSSQDNERSASVFSGLPRPRGSDTVGQGYKDTQQSGAGEQPSSVAVASPRIPSLNNSRESSNTRRNPFMRRRESSMSRRGTGEADIEGTSGRRRDSKGVSEAVANQIARLSMSGSSNLLSLPKPEEQTKRTQSLEPRSSNVPSDASHNTVRRPSNSPQAYNKMTSTGSDIKPLTWTNFDEGIDIDSRGGYGRRESAHFGFPGAKADKPVLPSNLPLPTVKRACGHYEIVDVDEARRQARHFRLYGEYPRGSNLLHERGVKGGFHPVGIKNRHNLEATSPWAVGIGGGSDLEGLNLCKSCKVKLRREDAAEQAKLGRPQTKGSKIEDGQIVQGAISPIEHDDNTRSPDRYGSAFIRGTDTPKERTTIGLQLPSLVAELGVVASAEAEGHMLETAQGLKLTRSQSDLQENDTGWRQDRNRSDTNDSDHAFNPKPSRTDTGAQMGAEIDSLSDTPLDSKQIVLDRAEAWQAKLDEDVQPLLREASQIEPHDDHRFFERTSTPSTGARGIAAETLNDFDRGVSVGNDSGISVANDMGRIFDRILLEHRAMLGSVFENLKSSDSRLSLASRLAQELSIAHADILTNTWHVHLPPQRYDEDFFGSEDRDDREATRALNNYTQTSISDILKIIDTAASDLGVDLHNASPVLKAHQHPPPLASADGASDMISSFDGPSDAPSTRTDPEDFAAADQAKLRVFWEQWSTGDTKGGAHLLGGAPQRARKRAKKEEEPQQFESFPSVTPDPPAVHAPTVLSPILSATEESRSGTATPMPLQAQVAATQALTVGVIGDVLNAMQETGSQIAHAVVDAEESAVDFLKSSLPNTDIKHEDDQTEVEIQVPDPSVPSDPQEKQILDRAYNGPSDDSLHVPLPHTIHPVAHRYVDILATHTAHALSHGLNVGLGNIVGIGGGQDVSLPDDVDLESSRCHVPLPYTTHPVAHRYGKGSFARVPTPPRIENFAPMSPPSQAHAHRYGNSSAGNANVKSVTSSITPILTPTIAKITDPFLYRSDSVRGEFSSHQLSRSELSLLDIHIPQSPKRSKSEDTRPDTSVSTSLERRRTNRASITLPHTMVMTPFSPAGTPGPQTLTPSPFEFDKEGVLPESNDGNGSSSLAPNSNEFTAGKCQSPSNDFTEAAKFQMPPPLPPPQPQGILAPTPRRRSTLNNNVNTLDTQPSQSISTPARRRSSTTSAQAPAAPSRRATSGYSQPSTEQISARLVNSPVPTRRSTVRQSITSLNAAEHGVKPPESPSRRSSTGPVNVERKPTFKPAGPAAKREKVMHGPPSRTTTKPKSPPVEVKEKELTPAGGNTGRVNPNPRYPAGGVSARKGRFEVPGVAAASAKAEVKVKEKGEWRQSGLEAKKAIQGRAVGVIGMKGRFE